MDLERPHAPTPHFSAGSLRQEVAILHYYIAFMAALPLYDSAITFLQEVQVLWCQTARPKSILLFYMNRFGIMLLGVTYIIEHIAPHLSCRDGFDLRTVAAIYLYVIRASVEASRVYALSPPNKRILISASAFVLAVLQCCEVIASVHMFFAIGE